MDHGSIRLNAEDPVIQVEGAHDLAAYVLDVY
jgi:hypothetical protein